MVELFATFFFYTLFTDYSLSMSFTVVISTHVWRSFFFFLRECFWWEILAPFFQNAALVEGSVGLDVWPARNELCTSLLVFFFSNTLFLFFFFWFEYTVRSCDRVLHIYVNKRKERERSLKISWGKRVHRLRNVHSVTCNPPACSVHGIFADANEMRESCAVCRTPQIILEVLKRRKENIELTFKRWRDRCFHGEDIK